MHGVFPSSRREFRIFTESSISLSQYWRQCSSHYTIHAGRNLPAKEFRYLRTVRVTAAVYQGFNFMLAHILFTLRHRAGIRPYTSCYYFAKSCVFTKQLPLPLSSHTPTLVSMSPLFRSYRVNLPSSFNTVISIAVVSATNSPVSVSSTVDNEKSFSSPTQNSNKIFTVNSCSIIQRKCVTYFSSYKLQGETPVEELST